MLTFHLRGEPPLGPSQPIVTMLIKCSALANVINCIKFHNDWLKGFRSAGIPENVMFPQESEVVLKTVLSAYALSRYALPCIHVRE
jgi:hypothetical protein